MAADEWTREDLAIEVDGWIRSSRVIESLVAFASRPSAQVAAIGAASAVCVFGWLSAGDAAATIGVGAGALDMNATVVAVILPTLLFVEATQRRGASAALGQWVQGIPAAPGLKILLLSARGSGLTSAVCAALLRAVKPLAAVVLFLLMSQAMVQGGMVDTLTGTLTRLDARVGWVLSPRSGSSRAP